MDFAPMSLRMMIPHANDVGEIQHNMNQQAAMQQDFKALQQKKLIERQQSQVRTKDEAEGEKIKDNPEKKQGGRERGPGRRSPPRRLGRPGGLQPILRSRLWRWITSGGAA